MILRRRAVDEIEEAIATGISISELPSRTLDGNTGRSTLTLLESGSSKENETFGSNSKITHDVQSQLIECRDRSSSIWLHFPHLELIFLLFAFHGVVASQAQVIHHTGLNCLPVISTAIILLVSQ